MERLYFSLILDESHIFAYKLIRSNIFGHAQIQWTWNGICLATGFTNKEINSVTGLRQITLQYSFQKHVKMQYVTYLFQAIKRIFDPFYENLDFGDWATQNGANDPELAAIIQDYFQE